MKNCNEKTTFLKNILVNWHIDLLLFLSFIGLLVTGVVIHAILPHGSGGGPNAVLLWNMGRHQWGDIHLIFAVGFIILSILHLIFHWRWIVCTFFGGENRKIKIVSTLFLVLLITGFVITLFLSPTHQNESRNEGQGQHRGWNS